MTRSGVTGQRVTDFSVTPNITQAYVMTQESVKSLIERAGQKVGSVNKLAKVLGAPSSQVYDWRDGRAPCSAADRARIAAFAGEDPVQELVRATLENARGEVRQQQLQQILGKSLRAIGAVLAGVSLALVSLTFSPRPAMAADGYDA